MFDIGHAIAGDDLSINEFNNLFEGDRILLECNGEEANPGFLGDAPPVASVSWQVMQSTDDKIILHNELVDIALSISKQWIIDGKPVVINQELSSMTKTNRNDLVTIIPKFFSYNISEEELLDYFQHKKYVKKISILRNKPEHIKSGLIIVKSFVQNLSEKGWSMDSLNRFQLKYDISDTEIKKVKKEKIESLYDMMNYADVAKLYAAVTRCQFDKRQRFETGINDEVIDLPPWSDRN